MGNAPGGIQSNQRLRNRLTNLECESAAKSKSKMDKMIKYIDK